VGIVFLPVVVYQFAEAAMAIGTIAATARSPVS
jgi:hypothetical protein